MNWREIIVISYCDILNNLTLNVLYKALIRKKAQKIN